MGKLLMKLKIQKVSIIHQGYKLQKIILNKKSTF